MNKKIRHHMLLYNVVHSASHDYVHSQFIRAECRLLESASTRDVLQNLVVLNARVGGAAQTEHLPACHSIRPLHV